MLCNLFFRSSLLGTRAFPQGMPCGEENRLLNSLARRGVRFIHDPDLWVWHERRSGLRGLARQVFQYGRMRAAGIRSGALPRRWAYFAPAMLVLGVVAIPLVAAAWPEPAWPGQLPLVYCALIGAGALVAAARSREWVRLPWVCVILPLLHLSYGSGFLVGFWQRDRADGD